MIKKSIVIALICICSSVSAWDDNPNTIFNIVVNHEEQYSIWPKKHQLPSGWKSIGKSCKKQECLNYIKEVWTDMRPLELYKKMKSDTRKVNGKSH